MADRVVDTDSQNVPEIPEMLERVLLFALDEGKQRMLAGEDVVPFTSLVVKDNVFIETHPGNDPEECFNYARHTVQGARGADAYAFCYDGYVETDAGTKDALIAEGGIPGTAEGFAVSYLYEPKEGAAPVFESEPAYVGSAPNFMALLKESTEYSDADIDSKYLDVDEEEIEE